MSSVPHYLDGRSGVKFGNVKVQDGMLQDGLTDVYNATHMGVSAELCARENNISREAQDAFAVESYRRFYETKQKRFSMVWSNRPTPSWFNTLTA